jgi:large subunit ribosomal protein L6
MSRVGKTLITIPSGVSVEFTGGTVTVRGGNSVLTENITGGITVEVENNTVTLKRPDDESKSKALHGLYNRLIQNMIIGVTKGFTKTLILNGVGYKAAMKGENLVLNLGMSHPSEVKAEQGIRFKILNAAEVQSLNLGREGIGVVLQISGANKEKVGAMASRIRDLRSVEPYHLYGIRYSDEHVIRKESKSGKKSGGKK